MATSARLALSAWRNETCFRLIRITGRDLSVVSLRLQIRTGADSPGAPLIDLTRVNASGSEGLFVTSVDWSTGIPVSTIELLITNATMLDAGRLPYSAEAGTDSELAYALQIDGGTVLYGPFVALANVMDSDAAPVGRFPGRGGRFGGGSAGLIAVTMAQTEVIDVTVDGVQAFAPILQRALVAQSSSETAAISAESSALVATTAGPHYATIAAGEAATAVGNSFAVAAGGAASWYRRTAGGSTPVFDINGFQAVSGSKRRTTTARLRESVSLADYWTPGDASAGLPAAFVAAYADGRALEIPKTFGTINLQNLNHVVPGGKDLVVGAKLVGGYGAQIVQEVGTSEIRFEQGQLHDVVLKLTGGTPRVFGGLFTGRANVAAILMQGAAGSEFMNMLIDGMDIRAANFGLLAQGVSHSAVGTQILNGRGFDLRGDYIELNVVKQMRNTQVINHSVDLLGGSSLPNWGLGFGFADFFDLMIANVQMSRMAQGIHVEYGERLSIANVQFREIAQGYAPSAGIESAGIFVYGGKDTTIDGVSGAGDIRIFSGANASTGQYLKPPKNVTVMNVDLLAGNVVVSGIGNDTTGEVTTGTFINVTSRSGFFELAEHPNHLVMQGVSFTRPKASGPAAILTPDLNIDGRQAFRATLFQGTPTSARIHQCSFRDEHGATATAYRTSLTAVAQTDTLPGWAQGMVEASGNNFCLTGGSAPRQINRTHRGAYGGLFPLGLVVVRGDLVACTDTGAQWLVEIGGSRQRTGDTFAVANDGTVRTTGGRIWPDEYRQGQAVILSGAGPAGAALATSVVQTPIINSEYRLRVADPIAAAAGATGTITVPTAAAWKTLRAPGGVSVRGDNDLTIGEGARAVQLFTAPLTAARTLTLSATGVETGRALRVARAAGATGAAGLSVNGLKILAAGQWCDVVFDGAAWAITGSGTL